MKGKGSKILVGIGMAAAGFLAAGAVLLTLVSCSLERSDPPVKSDAVVVLFHDTEVYYRMTEAARLYREGYADKVVINGGREHPVLKVLEAGGLSRDWNWEEEYYSVLEFLGVPLEDVIFIQVKDSFDSRGEAQYLGRKLLDRGFDTLIITTNRYHSRRAGYIWETLFGDRLSIAVVPIRDEPFSPASWFRDGRQFKWTLYELGSWLFLFTREFFGVEGSSGLQTPDPDAGHRKADT